MVCRYLMLLFFSFCALLCYLDLAAGTATYFSMPFDDIAYFNCSAMCGNSDTSLTVCIAGGEIIPFNLSTTKCCPVNVLVDFSIPGKPTKNNFGVTCEIWCGKEIVNTCTWSIHFTGVAPVSSMEYCVSTGQLSWSRPSFFSHDISQEEDPVYNISMSGVHIASTTDTSVYPNINNCSETETFEVTTSIGGYQSSKIETFSINVCNTTFLNNTEIYNSSFGAKITFQYQCSIKVCSFTYVISIDYGNGTISNDSFQVHPSNEKSFTKSHIINGLSPGNNTIEISFNSTGDVLDCTVVVPNNLEETMTPTSSFPPSSSIYATSSMSEESIGIGTTSSNIVVNKTTPVTSSSSSPTDKDSTSTNAALACVAIVLFFIIMIICCLLLYYIKKKKKEAAFIEELQMSVRQSDNESSATNQLDSTTATVATILDDDESRKHVNIFNAIKSSPVVMQGRPQDEDTAVALSDERSSLQEPVSLEKEDSEKEFFCHNYNGLPLDTSYCTTEQTLSFNVQNKSAIVTNHQAKSADRKDSRAEIESTNTDDSLKLKKPQPN